MKVKVLTRNPDEYMRETKRDIFKVPRNYNPDLHPFEGLREYTRALNAVKLDKVFAKPFVGSLDGHHEGISCVGKHPQQLSVIASGAFDGELKYWHLPTRKCIRTIQAHEGYIRGLVFTNDGGRCITVGDDKTIKTWKNETPGLGEPDLPVNTIVSKGMISGISHSQKGDIFATCGEACQLWEETRNEPIKTFQWGVDTIYTIAFNPIETNILGTCSNDRSITLYDTRNAGPVRKLVLSMRTNQIAWNPMESYIFTAANEDYNLYTFDTRMMMSAATVHKDHISAVISVDYSPTGLEFVSGSYDRTVRIFEANKSTSREVYHTKRMQRLTAVSWSLDNKYVLSASDEMNIRIWKSKASEKLGVLKPRERASLQYGDALKKKFGAFPQVKKIARHRHVPKYIVNARNEHQVIRLKEKRKEANRRAHSRPGSVPFTSEKKKNIVEIKE